MFSNNSLLVADHQRKVGEMKKVLAVIVSIFWLALVVGVPALVLSGNAGQLVPVQMQEQLSQLVGQGFLARFGIAGNEPVTGAGEPSVMAETVTPAPVEEPTTAATEPPAATPTTASEPTATPLPEPTNTPAAAVPTVPAIAIPAAVRSQAELRTGPGLDFDAVGLVDAGATILVSGQDETGEWFLMENGNWILGEALASVPAVPIVLPAQEVVAEVTPTTPAVEEPSVPATPATPVVVKVNADANLRSGPGGTFERVGGANFGSDVTVVGKLATDNWYVLDTGSWIFGELLESAPDVPEVNADGTPVSGGASVVTNPPVATTPTVETPATPITSTNPITPTANNIANLRAAPDISASVVGSTTVGQALVLVGKNAAGDWLKLDSGSWIFAELVDNAPADLPVVAEDAAVSAIPTATPIAAQPEAATPITTTATTTTTVSTTTPAEVTPAEATPAGTTTETNGDSNLRAGPGQSFDIVGSVLTGTALTIIGRNEAGDWLKLENGAWIFGELVVNAPTDLPVVDQ